MMSPWKAASAGLLVALFCLSGTAFGQDATHEIDDVEGAEKLQYQPTLTYNEHNDKDTMRTKHKGVEFVHSDPDFEAIKQAERAYFIARDHDGDGALSQEEFARELNDVTSTWDKQYAEDATGTEWDSFNVKERKRTLPNKDALLWGKDWKSSLSGTKAAEEAFKEFDSDGDGKCSWDEWSSMMLHGEPQMPEFRNGEIVVDESGLDDDEVSDDEIKMIKKRFKDFDLDKDDHLTAAEVQALIRHSHDSPEFDGGVHSYVRPTDDEMAKYAKEIVAAQDGDKDGKITMDEWVRGGGY